LNSVKLPLMAAVGKARELTAPTEGADARGRGAWAPDAWGFIGVSGFELG
jgi:hypothetical protein